MKSSSIAPLDLQLAPSDESVLRDPQRLRSLLCAGLCGLLAGGALLGAMQHDQRQLRALNAPVKAELEALQKAHRQHEAQLKALQDIDAQWQQHRQHQARWQSAAEILQALGRSTGASGRLTELRIDAQGLTVSGHIAPSQLQPWLHRLTAQAPALGSWSSVDIGGAPQTAEASDEESATRFVIRFGTQAAPEPLTP